ncbi:MAG: hypothetical protein WD468_01725 [Pirellulales bacterium]
MNLFVSNGLLAAVFAIAHATQAATVFDDQFNNGAPLQNDGLGGDWVTYASNGGPPLLVEAGGLLTADLTTQGNNRSQGIRTIDVFYPGSTVSAILTGMSVSGTGTASTTDQLTATVDSFDTQARLAISTTNNFEGGDSFVVNVMRPVNGSLYHFNVRQPNNVLYQGTFDSWTPAGGPLKIDISIDEPGTGYTIAFDQATTTALGSSSGLLAQSYAPNSLGVRGLFAFIGPRNVSSFKSAVTYDRVTVDGTGGDAALRLRINRDNGEMTLVNARGINVPDFIGYNISSAAGTLDSGQWLSIADNYDGDQGSEVDDDAWVIFSQTDLLLDEGTSGSATLANSQQIPLGLWKKGIKEDVVIKYFLPDGITQANAIVEFYGNNGQPYQFGDLDFNGATNANDYFNVLLPGLSTAGPLGALPVDSYPFGDMDGDLDVDLTDFVRFKKAYDAVNGSGAFVAMLAAVPEPASWLLVSLTVGLVLTVTRRRTRLRSLALGALSACLVSSQQAVAIPTTITQFAFTQESDLSITGALIGAQTYGANPVEGIVNGVPFDVDNSWIVGSVPAWRNGSGDFSTQFSAGSDLDKILSNCITTMNDSNVPQITMGGLTVGKDYRFQILETRAGTVGSAAQRLAFSILGESAEFIQPGGETMLVHVDFTAPTTEVVASFFRASNGHVPHVNAVSLHDISPDTSSKLTLRIDPSNGKAGIFNNSPHAIPLDVYEVASQAGLLNTTTWESLSDKNYGSIGPDIGESWDEVSNLSPNTAAEVFLLGRSTLAPGAAVGLGTLFNIGPQLATDTITLRYHRPGDAATFFYNADVEFGEVTIGTSGDYNNDGNVDAADYIIWRKTDGSQAGYDLWRTNYGASSGHASGSEVLGQTLAQVPEPSTCMVAVFLAALLLDRKRRQ